MGDVIRLVDNLQLMAVDTSAVGKRYLLTTDKGRQFELSEMMADVVFALKDDGDLERVAKRLSEQWKQDLSIEHLELIIENYLKKWGLIDQDLNTGRAPEQIQAPEGKQRLDQIHFKFIILRASALKPIARLTIYFYRRELSIILLTVALWVHYVVLRDFESNRLAQTIFNSAGSSYLKIYALLFICVLWHELGHVSALARFGRDAKGIGFGIYFVFPVMYTDVSECWVLKRWQRVVVDCGGIYFQAITALPLYGLYLITNSPIPIFMILVNFSLILLTLNPILKFDGYWMLSDALGVINFREKSLALISHYFRRLVLRQRPEMSERLRFPRSIKAFSLIYGICSSILVTVWVLGLFLYAPRMLSSYLSVVLQSGSVVGKMISELELVKSAGVVLRLLLQAIPIFAILALLYRINKRLIQFAAARLGKEQW
jgi:hypothetical protein